VPTTVTTTTVDTTLTHSFSQPSFFYCHLFWELPHEFNALGEVVFVTLVAERKEREREK
jgi:hypothetical protein